MKLGDLFAKLAAGEQLTGGEIEQLRLGMNQQQGITSQMSALLTPDGDLDPNIFSHHARGFGMLPHESGGMYTHNDDVQSVPKETLTTVEFQDTDEAPHVQWEEGVKLDFTNFSIKLSGAPKGSLWLLYGMINWGDVPANWWQAGFVDSVSTRGVQSLGSTESIDYTSAVLQTEAAGADWTMYVYHYEAAAIDLDSAWFSATRLR